jgi:FAD/FMN-containing dehydrogenase
MRRFTLFQYHPPYFLIVYYQKLSNLLEKVMDPDAGLVTSGVLAQSPTQFESLWAIREGIPEAVGKAGKVYKYDVSIPVLKFKEIVDKLKDHLQSKGLLHENAVKDVVGFGHFGDGEENHFRRIFAPDLFPR